MKTKIIDINGKEKASVDLPKCFSAEIREDIVTKVLEAKKSQQPYAPSPVAGKQHSASGRLIHRRHVWNSQYGRGMSRVPRKTMTRKGSQFNWVAAEIPSVRGGRRAHPPKILSMMNSKKINKKEMLIALLSAITATASKKNVVKRYGTLEDKNVGAVPFVVESKIISLKTKEFIASLKKILGTDLFGLALKKKSVRAGCGKRRGRKYKSNAGMLFVVGNEEKLKRAGIDTVHVKNLGVTELANGGVGRLTVYTENAIKDLGGRLK